MKRTSPCEVVMGLKATIQQHGKALHFPIDLLTRRQLREVEGLPSLWARTKYVLARCCPTLNLETVDFGHCINLAQTIAEISLVPDPMLVINDEMKKQEDPDWIYDQMIVTAFPAYTFEDLDNLSLESYLRMRVKAQWNMTQVRNVPPEQIMSWFQVREAKRVDVNAQFEKNKKAMEALVGAPVERDPSKPSLWDLAEEQNRRLRNGED